MKVRAWTMLGVLLGLGAAAAPAVAPRPPALPAGSWSLGTERTRALRLDALRHQPLEKRLVEVSAGFLGTPYQTSPLGEGSGRDADPLIRYDAVDCLTFVEETLALSLAPSSEAVVSLLSSLRYQREVSYDDRNHLMEAQWIPSNVAKGYLEDVTRAFGEDATVRTRKVLTPASWRSTSSRSLGLPAQRQLTGSFPLEMVPFDAAFAVASRAPSGTLLLVVRDDLPWKATRISHLGFLVHARGGVFLRHATKGWVNQVVDEELGHFLARISRHNETDAWKVVGISLYGVREPPPESKRP